MSRERFKRMAALKAVEQVRSGMVVGLGHGSTAIHALRRIAELLESGELSGVRAVACSRQVEQDARDLGIPLVDLDDVEAVDLTIDGADEVDEDLNCIKGGGGALLREKIVAQASRREVIVVDDSKLSRRLGERFRLPVEVVRFGMAGHKRHLETLGATVELRMQGEEPFRTDQGNCILDCDFGPIDDPAALGKAIISHAGIVEHGLFVGLAHEVVSAGESGLLTMVRD